ncbi:hypothetical protein pb186bvf_007944 [Paramecium bursaria]
MTPDHILEEHIQEWMLPNVCISFKEKKDPQQLRVIGKRKSDFQDELQKMSKNDQLYFVYLSPQQVKQLQRTPRE